MVRTPYQVVARLFAIADDYWPHLEARYYQINLVELPMYRFLNLVYAWAYERVETEKIEQFEYELMEPLPGREREIDERTAEIEGAGFMEAMQTLKRG